MVDSTNTRIVVPEVLEWALAKGIHQATHLGQTKLTELLKAKYYIPHLHELIKKITTPCDVCARVNSGGNRSSQVGVRLRRTSPGEHWEVDFTEIKPPENGYKYLLVFVDTFSGWVEGFPPRSKTALVVTIKLLEDLVPQFSLPLTLGLACLYCTNFSGPSQDPGYILELHCAYHPQRSGQVK